MTTGRPLGKLNDDIYVAREITAENIDFMLMSSTYKHGNRGRNYQPGGHNKLSVKGRVAYMRQAIATGIVQVDCAKRAVDTLRNLEAQL